MFFGYDCYFGIQAEPLLWKEDDAMAQTMTPSAESKTATVGQIDKAVANYRALLEKHGREFNSEAVQLVLGQPELADEQFAVFRRRVKAVSNMIVRRVKVNRGRAPQEMLDATGRKQYTNREVVDNMPRGEGEEVEVFFFNVGLYLSDDELEKEYELRGLKSADPYATAAVNEADPSFADEHPNGCHWKDANGRWNCTAFYRWDDERCVLVDRRAYDWDDDWWFAGARK